MSIRTLAELFQVSAQHRKSDCLLHKVNGAWVPISTESFVADVRRLAKALVEAGVRPGDRVALMAENGPHWSMVDFAALAIGAAVVPIYPTLLPEGAAYVARDSGSRILFVAGSGAPGGHAESARPDAGRRENRVDRRRGARGGSRGVRRVSGLRLRGHRRRSSTPGASDRSRTDLATLIYTSGTTGDPKGVMLTHGNLASNVVTGCGQLGLKGHFTALSFLPLSHSFERMVDYCYFFMGVTIAYAESIQAVPQNLQEVKPHVFVAVPRLYEKIMARAYENAAAAGGAKAKIFRWAVKVGKDALPKRLRFQNPGVKARAADKLVFSKLRAKLGGRFEFGMSGGAPLARDVAEFFWAAGLPIYEGYGLTETSPVLSVNTRTAVKLGTVGKPMPDVEIKIVEDGEILARGPNIMKGYFGNPEATAEVLDADLWFKTGDIGHLDDEGYLVITDRKKELIVNAYGKNIAPAPIENALKANRFVSQAMVVGDKRQFLSALLVPDFEAFATWATAEKIGGSVAEQLAHGKSRALFQAEVDIVNAQLARYEQLRNFEVVPNDFTLEGGELTPTLKIKRRVVQQKYKDLLDKLYAAGEKS